jgi:hypothetical protein
MTQATKFADLIRNATTHEREKLADAIQAAAEHLSPADLKPLIAGLTEIVKADAEKNSAKSKRIAKMNAAQANVLMEPTIKFAAGRLRSLGLDLNVIAASADVNAVDKAMSEKKWTGEQRIGLKSALAHIGAIE